LRLLALCRHQEREMPRRCGRDSGEQVGMRGDVNVYWMPLLILGLAEADAAISNVLRPKTDGIFSAASGVEHQGEGEAGATPNGMPHLELVDFIGSPGMEAHRGIFELPHAERRILLDEIVLHRPAKQCL